MRTLVDIPDHSKAKELYIKAFGIWKEKKLNSLEYQRKLREEWK